MAVGQRFQLTCGKCGREMTLAAQALAKRRSCIYCGIPLDLPTEVLQAIAAIPAGAAPQKSGPPISVECPLCARSAKVKGALAGQTTTCTFCGCPMRIPEADGLADLVPATQSLPKLSVGESLTAPCPSCHAQKLQAANDGGTEATCAACQAKVDCTKVPLERFVDLPPNAQRAPLLKLAREALRVRWARRELGLAEAFSLFGDLGSLEQWTARPEGASSPFDVELTAEICRWAVLLLPTATGGMKDGEVRLSIPLYTDEAREMASGRAAVPNIGAQAMAAVRASTIDLPSLEVWFRPVAEGTAISIEVKHTVAEALLKAWGQFSQPVLETVGPAIFAPLAKAVADKRLIEKLGPVMKKGLPEAMRQLLAFRALFGLWASVRLFYAATEKGVARRLAALGPAFAKDASAWANALCSRTVVAQEDIQREYGNIP